MGSDKGILDGADDKIPNAMFNDNEDRWLDSANEGTHWIAEIFQIISCSKLKMFSISYFSPFVSKSHSCK